jgi:hypothetical protein
MRVCLCQMDRRYQMRRYHIRVCSAFERRTHARKGAEERTMHSYHPLAAMDARFGSWDDALDLRSPKQASRWVADCEACCFKARLLQKLEAGAEGEYSQGETFWLAADSEPRCMLEQVARSIFAKHAAALGSYDPRRSGAEYWSLCIDADDDDVGLHWDKDFALEAEEGTNLTPAVATVTYLTGQGAPTIMLSRPPPSRLGEPLDDGALISRGYLSHPAPGKHIAFDGRWLHGAPMDLARGGVRTGKRRKRVSLLVNVWLDHRPALAVPLPAELVIRLSPLLARLGLGLGLELGLGLGVGVGLGLGLGLGSRSNPLAAARQVALRRRSSDAAAARALCQGGPGRQEAAEQRRRGRRWRRRRRR